MSEEYTTNLIREMVGYAKSMAKDRRLSVLLAQLEGEYWFDRWLEQHDKDKEREVLERTATKIEQFGKSWVGAEGFGLILESGKMSELFARIIREMK